MKMAVVDRSLIFFAEYVDAKPDQHRVGRVWDWTGKISRVETEPNHLLSLVTKLFLHPRTFSRQSPPQTFADVKWLGEARSPGRFSPPRDLHLRDGRRFLLASSLLSLPSLAADSPLLPPGTFLPLELLSPLILSALSICVHADLWGN